MNAHLLDGCPRRIIFAKLGLSGLLHFADVDVNWVQGVPCIDSPLRCRQQLLFESSDPPEIGRVVVDQVFLTAHTAFHRSGSVASQARGINRPWPIGNSAAGRCDSRSHTP